MADGAQRTSGSSAQAVGWAWAALVVYATLYPFSRWTWPPGADALSLLILPWPRWIVPFDVVSNLLGYLPLGALGYVAGVSAGLTRGQALGRAVLGSACLSFALEIAQNLLPGRVPSLLDLLLNAAGALLGALIGLALHGWGVLAGLRIAAHRWVQHRGLAGLLLLSWPVGLLFPTPLPLGLGQIGGELRELATWALTDVPWATQALDWLDAIEPALEPLSPAAEWLAVALGLLGPCLLAFAASRPGLRRVPLALGALAIGTSATTLSTLLNFGPEHAMAWLTATTVPALLSGFVAALLLVRIGARLAAALGLLAIPMMLVLVAQAPADPYFAASLQAWEQGRFIRFHGAAQWVGWLWPYVALTWLLHRLSAGE
jgi:VanZ family protein